MISNQSISHLKDMKSDLKFCTETGKYTGITTIKLEQNGNAYFRKGLCQSTQEP